MKQKQNGTILVVSLIMLLVLTVVGAASIRQSGTNEKSAANYRDHDTAFEAAEAALKQGELLANEYTLSLSDFDPTCTGANCYTPSCNEGRCFNGNFVAGGTCDLTPQSTPLWAQRELWEDADRHATYFTEMNSLSRPPKYIVEFMCFSALDPDAETPPPTPPPYGPEWALMFRITALGYGEGTGSRVMLQSTYKTSQQ